jgi:hypothetical protein
MSAETLAAFAGVALSLAFSYIPGLKDKFGELPAAQKQMWMGVLLIVTAGVIVGIGCAGISPVVVCTQAGLIEFGGVLVSALVANQATFLISPKARPLP